MSIEKLIVDASDRVDIDTASALLHRGLTLGGRVEWKAALAVLSPAERHACDRIIAQQRWPSVYTGNFSLAFRPHGRLYLLPREEFETQAELLKLLCYVELDGHDLQTYYALRQSAHQALEQERAEICVDLNEQGFEHVCAELASIAEHMAPLIYYVGERCISNFYNAGKSSFALERTLARALQEVAERREQADIEDLTAVHCLHLVLRSGGYTRLEELNSLQLSRCAVSEFFDAKRVFYEQACGCPSEGHFGRVPLREKAALLARMREAIGTRQRFIRLIKGTSLSKTEAVLPVPPASTCDVVFPPAHVWATLQRCMPGTSVQRLFSPENFKHLLGTALLPEEQVSSFDSCLEYLLDRVVAEAVHNTNSDIGMTRSARDYRRFAKALRERQTALACGWSQAEYFCHVVPSQAFLKSLSPKALSMTLNAISARMRFNSWHYAPSYFDAADVPPGRIWFTAPRMADIADDSDQHHTGHIQAVVRYSIRSPLPLCVGRQVLPGFIDLRVMRQSGNPYTRQDLVTAIAYTEVLQFIYQHVMNHVLERDAGFIFSFGDKKWFDDRYRAQADSQPVTRPTSLPGQTPSNLPALRL